MPPSDRSRNRARTRARGKKAAKPKLSRKVHRKVLDNGLRVLLVESRELPVVSHWIWYAVGSRDEKTGETGLSHFLEHMMFKGTNIYPKGTIDAATARLGGSNNAMTSYDYTTYYFNLKSDRWTEALKIEANRMRHCLLDPSELEAEKKVVIEELQMGEDEPWRPLWQAIESSAYQVHSYRHPVIGWREDLERLDRDRMVDYYRRHYSPDRAVLVVVGDLKAREAMPLIEEHMGPLEPSGHPHEEVIHEPAQRGERRLIVRFPGNLARIGIAWHICRFGEHDDVVLDLASFVLSAGRSARFYKTLVQGREIATSADAINETRRDPGMFWILAEGKPEVSPEQLEAAVLEEVQRLADEGPEPAELRRCKKMILNSFYFDLETVANQASKIGRAEILHPKGLDILLRYPDELSSVTAREIKEVMRRYLTADNRTVGWSLPGGNA